MPLATPRQSILVLVDFDTQLAALELGAHTLSLGARDISLARDLFASGYAVVLVLAQYSRVLQLHGAVLGSDQAAALSARLQAYFSPADIFVLDPLTMA